MYARASFCASGDTRVESVRMYVMSATLPSPGMSTPSYSACAADVVCLSDMPSLLSASCCIVLVMNGAGACDLVTDFLT